MYMNNILTDYDYQCPFMNGFAEVRLNDTYYKLDTEGNLTLKESHKLSVPLITESILRNIIRDILIQIL